MGQSLEFESSLSESSLRYVQLPKSTDKDCSWEEDTTLTKHGLFMAAWPVI